MFKCFATDKITLTSEIKLVTELIHLNRRVNLFGNQSKKNPGEGNEKLPSEKAEKLLLPFYLSEINDLK